MGLKAESAISAATFNDLLAGSALSVIQPPFIKSALPTVTFSASAMSGAETFYAIPGRAPASTALSPYFSFYAGASTLTAYNTNQGNLGSYSVAHYNVNDAPFTTVFDHVGSQLDIICFGDAEDMDVYVDEQLLSHYSQAITSGTAQAGASNTITLASGASTTNGYYNQCYVTITGGTGAGQTRQITGYAGGTLVATVASAWTTTPTGSSTYVVTGDPSGIALKGLDGSTNFLNLNFGTAIQKRRITVVSAVFTGVNIGPNDSLSPASPEAGIRMVCIGDSILQSVGSPLAQPIMIEQIGRGLGAQIINQGAYGTGWVSRNTPLLNFLDQIAPPNESWTVTGPIVSSGGTFTLSVTYGGSTQTTGALAYNATASTVQSALNALSNVSASNAVAGNGDTSYRPLKVLLYNMPGATLSMNSSGLTSPALTPSVAQWTGSVAPNVPYDGNGNPLPFLLYVQGSGNDAGAGAAAIQANAVAAAQAINQRFPTAIVIFTGVVATGTQGGAGVINATDAGFNAAIKAGAALLPFINGKIPFIDTYAAGVGGNAWITGSGTVASPTSGTNDILRSVIATSHPTGNGHAYLAARIIQAVKALFGAR